MDNIEIAKTQIELKLGIKLVERDSDYLGIYYALDFDDKENIVCQMNKDPYEDEWMENSFKMYPVLIYVNGTTRPYEFEERLKSSEVKFDLLRRENQWGQTRLIPAERLLY